MTPHALSCSVRQLEAIRGNWRQLEAIRGNWRQLEVVRGHQRPSEVNRGHQRSSEVIRGHQRPSEAIRGHQRPSEAIRGHLRSQATCLLGQLGGRLDERRVDSGHRAHVDHYALDEPAIRHLRREAIRRHSRPSEIISDRQWSSEAIKGHHLGCDHVRQPRSVPKEERALWLDDVNILSRRRARVLRDGSVLSGRHPAQLVPDEGGHQKSLGRSSGVIREAISGH